MWDSALGGRPPAVTGRSDVQFGDLPGSGHKGQAIITTCVYVCVCVTAASSVTVIPWREKQPLTVFGWAGRRDAYTWPMTPQVWTWWVRCPQIDNHQETPVGFTAGLSRDWVICSSRELFTGTHIPQVDISVFFIPRGKGSLSTRSHPPHLPITKMVPSCIYLKLFEDCQLFFSQSF